MDPDTCIAAIGFGHLDCLQYAHENGCTLYQYQWLCEMVAVGGYLDCLQYAHENGCLWDEKTCESAIKYKHLDCLIYARTCVDPCPWGSSWQIAYNAKYYEGLECLKQLGYRLSPYELDILKYYIGRDSIIDNLYHDLYHPRFMDISR